MRDRLPVILGQLMLQRFLLLWLVLTSAAAFWWPVLEIDIDPWIVWSGSPETMASRFPLGGIVALTMFAIGALLPRDEVTQVLQRWQTVFGGTAIQYTAMPLLAFALATLFHLPRELFIGVVLVGCVPGAMASNVLTLAARGNVSYSVSLTTAATLLSPIIVPFALSVALSSSASIDPANVSLKLLREVVGPVIGGHLLARHWLRFASVMQILGGPIANLAILWIIATVVALNRERLADTPFTVVGALLLLNALGYLAGYAGSKAIGISERMRRALTLEVGMQNAGVGTALAAEFFRNEPTAMIPTAAYTFGCMLTGTILAWWFARRDQIQDELRDDASA